MKVEIKLDQDDVNLLGQYLCQSWTTNQGNSGDIFGSTFWDVIDRYSSGRPIKWSHTPSIEAETLMDFILETCDKVSYQDVNLIFYWENDND